MGADGSGQTRISFGDGSYSTPVWSPRGDLIAFTKQSGGEFQIGVMKTDGSGERILSTGFQQEGPTWAPNGRVLMFFREAAGSGGPQPLFDRPDRPQRAGDPDAELRFRPGLVAAARIDQIVNHRRARPSQRAAFRAAFPPRVRGHCEHGMAASRTGESQTKLTMFLERRLTATWLLDDQRNHSNAKERPACAASQHSPRNPLIIALVPDAGDRRLRQQEDAEQRGRSRPRRGAATPGSAQDFTVNVGDRIFFDTDSLGRSAPTRKAILGRQAQWLNQYTQLRASPSKAMPTSAARANTTWRSAPAAPPPRATISLRAASPANRMKTISYGKERPVAVCDDISCWSQNRRAVTDARRRRQLRPNRSHSIVERRPFGRLFRLRRHANKIWPKSRLALKAETRVCAPNVPPIVETPMYFRSILSGTLAICLSGCSCPARRPGGRTRRAPERNQPDTAESGLSLPKLGLPKLFGGREKPAGEVELAQAGDPRITALEEQVRALSGTIEELNFQILQMQEQMRKMQEDNEFRFQELEQKKTTPARRADNNVASAPTDTGHAAGGRRPGGSGRASARRSDGARSARRQRHRRPGGSSVGTGGAKASARRRRPSARSPSTTRAM